MEYFLHLVSVAKEALYSLLSMDADQVSNLFLFVTVAFFCVILRHFCRRLNAARRALQEVCAKIDEVCKNDCLDSSALEDFKNISRETEQFAGILKEYNNQMYATQDIESTCKSLWYPTCLQSKVFSASAPILTGIGVLGTFVGLLIGLRGLQLDGDMHNLQNEIRQVSTGASVAFETSVWGVALSLLFTFVEKWISGRTMDSYLALQNRLNVIFPAFPYSAVMVDQAEAVSSSKETLSTLAEQLAAKFQATMDDTRDALLQGMVEAFRKGSDQVADSINTTLSQNLLPAVDDLAKSSKELAERQASVAEDALRSLVGQFAEGVHKEGDRQHELMQQTNGRMQETLRTFSESMGSLIGSLANQRDQLATQTDEQAQKLSEVFKEMTENQKAQIGNISASLGAMMTEQLDAWKMVAGSFQKDLSTVLSSVSDFCDGLQEHRKAMDERALKHTEEFEHLLSGVAHKMDNVNAFLEKNIREHIEATKSLLEQGQLLQDRTEAERRDFAKIGDGLQKAAIEIDQAATNMKGMSTGLQEAGKMQMESLADTNNLLQQFSAIFDHASAEMRTAIGELATLPESFDNVAQLLARTSEDAQKRQSELAQSFKNMQDQMRKCAEEMALGVHNAMENARKQIAASVDQVARTLNDMGERQTKQMQEIFAGMLAQVDALDDAMTETVKGMFSEFDSALNDRFKQWNDQTREYSECMIRVAESLSEVVDSLDTHAEHTKVL